jgi:DNA-binding CsgD family transcriptional regulator
LWNKDPFRVQLKKKENENWVEVSTQTKRKRKTNSEQLDEATAKKLKEMNHEDKRKWMASDSFKYKSQDISEALSLNPSSLSKLVSRSCQKAHTQSEFEVEIHGFCCGQNCFRVISSQLLKTTLQQLKSCLSEREENKILSELFTSIKALTSSWPCYTGVHTVFAMCHTRFQNVIDRARTNHSIHGNQSNAPKNKLTEREIKSIQVFGKKHLLPMPERENCYYFPYSSWGAFVDDYNDHLRRHQRSYRIGRENDLVEDNLEWYSVETFKKYIKQDYKKIKAMPPDFAACKICHGYNGEIGEINQRIREKKFLLFRNGELEVSSEIETLESRKRKKKDALEKHREFVRKERSFYKNQIKTAKEDESIMEISLDYKSGVTFPKMRSQPQEMYFLSKPLCHVFGIVEESKEPVTSTLYMYSNEVGKQNWRHVVVMVEKYILENKTEGQHQLILRADNCGGQNKNKYMMAYAADLVRREIFDTVRIDYLPVGHTKFSCDRVFGILSNCLNRSHIYNSQNIVDVSNNISNVTGVFLQRKDFVDYTELFETNFQSSIIGMNDKLHFKFFRSKANGKQVIRCLSAESSSAQLVEARGDRGKIVYPESCRSWNIQYATAPQEISEATCSQLTQDHFKDFEKLAQYIPSESARKEFLQEINEAKRPLFPGEEDEQEEAQEEEDPPNQQNVYFSADENQTIRISIPVQSNRKFEITRDNLVLP